MANSDEILYIEVYKKSISENLSNTARGRIV
jgi:hypothetical protein